MFRLLAAVALPVVAFALAAAPAPAQDKKDKDKPPVWEREANGVDLRIEFGKDALKFSAFHGENGAVITCKTTTDKDGTVKATVTEATEKGNFPATPKKGYEFSFKWKEKGDAAELSDLKGEGLDDARAAIEGEYKKKK
jgi:hypothetical protein